MLAAGASLLPALPHLDSSAYPSEPEKRLALDLCSRSDPTFIRFIPSERAACYQRVSNLTVAAAENAVRPATRRPVINPPPQTVPASMSPARTNRAAK